ncbi:restriction endonuclease subunit S [Chryseobacterium sp.]|uniref:restriction endonuclease subunit S n=1 Tax=Chryseobacterium sp. TaxID=1871047 RepID=UPI002896C989|nr:restriction endonuclease subunit S [Chryseobacterium sp.]
MRDWQEYRLGDFLKRHYHNVQIDNFKKYKRITIRSKGQGIELRDEVYGIEIGTKNQFVVKQNQFLLSKIDALNGAFGIVPTDCNGGVITGNFWTYDIDESIVLKEYLNLLCIKQVFTKFSLDASEGTTNRKYLREEKFLNLVITLPAICEQKMIVSQFEKVKLRLETIDTLRKDQSKDISNLLFSKYTDLIKDSEWVPMKIIAPIIRRPVVINDEEVYPELGIRSFGKGTFHKPAITASEVASKKIFQIKTDDLVFSNVFAWEGAIAVAKAEDHDRYASHRFISCVVDDKSILVHFLLYHFLSPKGLEDINNCSPGGAGRNKTLGLEKLMNISVPVPKIELQKEFVKLLAWVNRIRKQHSSNTEELAHFIPSFLNKAFKGDILPKSAITQMKNNVSLAVDKKIDKIPNSELQRTDDLELAMIIALMESKLGNTYGEVGIQKTVFNIEAFHSVLHHKYNFSNYHYGTYSEELRDKIKSNPLLGKKEVKGNEVFTISATRRNTVLDALNDKSNRQFVMAINDLLDIYSSPFISKHTDRIELLNTVTKLVMDLQTTELDIIYEGMKKWDIAQSGFKTKADKFDKVNTRKTIELLTSTGLISRLLN